MRPYMDTTQGKPLRENSDTAQSSSLHLGALSWDRSVRQSLPVHMSLMGE